MNVSFRKSFTRDLKKIKDRPLLDRIAQTIEEAEAAAELKHVTGVAKIAGTDDFFRIRIGDYRIGIVAGENEVEFVRCLHRRELYRFFP